MELSRDPRGRSFSSASEAISALWDGLGLLSGQIIDTALSLVCLCPGLVVGANVRFHGLDDCQQRLLTAISKGKISSSCTTSV